MRFGILHSALILTVVVPSYAAEPTTKSANDSPDRAAVRALVRAAVQTPTPAAPDRPAVARWLDANRESVAGVTPGPLGEQPWGYSTYRPAASDKSGRLYLHVFDWHASGKVIAYGLGGEVKRAYFLSSPDRPLPTAKAERVVVVTGTRQPPDALDTVVVLELDGPPQIVPLAVGPSPDGSILLHAKDVIVHGRTVRYEPEPNKNTVGYWTDPADWVEWQFTVPVAGRYAAEILQGCGKGSGGSTVDFAAGGGVRTVTVQDTGGFQNFVPRDIGTFEFAKPGTYTLTVKPTKKPGQAVMDLRQVKLSPVP